MFILLLKKELEKIISVVKLDGITNGKNEEVGTKLAMHIAASNPLAIDKDKINQDIIDKEIENYKIESNKFSKDEIINEIEEKISKGTII